MQKWEKLLIYSVFLFLIMSIPVNTIAQSLSDGITASTNSLSYKPGEKVTITGTVKGITSNNPVTILVRNPIQNVYAVGQVDIHDNVFVHEFVLNENSKPGTYTADIKYGDQSTKIQFIVTSGLIQIIPVESSSIKVRGDTLGLIKYKNAHVSPQENSITIQLSIESPINPIPQEFEIPKEVIDAEQSLIVEADGKTLTCSETKTSQLRIMDCFIPQGAKELKFIGTSVIPEFGTVSLFVLIISLISLIAFTKTISR
jgi:predicted secreted protein with PEFG-CTERM motif